MYYKVLNNNKVVDVLDSLIYLKWLPKRKIMVLCPESEAQAILSSDCKNVWHESSLYQVPVAGYETVTVEQIDKFEYDRLRALNGSTPEEIIDSFVLSLIKEGVFV